MSAQSFHAQVSNAMTVAVNQENESSLIQPSSSLLLFAPRRSAWPNQTCLMMPMAMIMTTVKGSPINVSGQERKSVSSKRPFLKSCFCLCLVRVSASRTVRTQKKSNN